MADEQDFVRNIDKISYGVAAVVGIAVLALPFVSGGGLGEASADLRTQVDALRTKRREQETGAEPTPVIALYERLQKDWTIQLPSEDAKWVTERIPILVRRQEEPEPEPAVHLPGAVTRIEFRRDAEEKEPYLEVTGKLHPENRFVRITRVQLYRQVDDGDATPVPGFEATGDFTYEDRDVEPGRKYAYHFVSHAETPDARLHPLDTAQQSSQVCGPTLPVPYDFNLAITFFQGEALQATVVATASYYDYEAGKVVTKESATYEEGSYIDDGERWRIRRVLPDVGGGEVHVKDGMTLETETFRPGGDDRTVEAFPPVECDLPTAGPSGGEAAAEGEGEESAPEAETAPAEEEDDDTGGRRRPRFGGDRRGGFK